MGERIAMAIMLATLAAAVAGMYLAWRDCDEAGGVLVRGLVKLECINKTGDSK